MVMTEDNPTRSGQEYSADSDVCPAKTDGSTDFDLAIVGGGFSGLCTSYHLFTHERLKSGFRCAIVEPGACLGAGIAYRTDCPHHLLNVRAKGMSITESDPGSFVRWLAESAPEYSPDDFVPRGLYRRYTNDCLSKALAGRETGVLTTLRDEVCALTPESSGLYRLALKSGRILHAGIVVLAMGNLPPICTLDNGLLQSPWQPPGDYGKLRTLGIVGAGLTALDVILEAEASGFSGRFYVISPHGQFPRSHHEPHQPVSPELRQWAAELASSRPNLRMALREFQRKRKSGVPWECLVDSLRRHSPFIWSNFTVRDQKRFLRNFRNLWNAHLHRTCRKSMEVISQLKACGRLIQISARVTGVEKREQDGDRAVRLSLKCGPLAALDVDMAINATGLFSDILRTDSALVPQLIEARLAQPDEFRLGFKINESGQLLSADSIVQPGLFTIGALRRGRELESTAVPEIRRQVRDMIEKIISMMHKNV